MMAMMISEMDPGTKLIVAVNDSAITMATVRGTVSWKTDGRKRQEAQMDGTLIETQGLWKDDVLQLNRAVAGTASVHREFKVAKDGNTLELKETLEANGRKVEKKLVFARE